MYPANRARNACAFALSAGVGNASLKMLVALVTNSTEDGLGAVVPDAIAAGATRALTMIALNSNLFHFFITPITPSE